MIEVICREGLHVFKTDGPSVHIKEAQDGAVTITIQASNGISVQSITLPPTVARTLGYRIVRYANRALKEQSGPKTGSDPQSDPKP